MFRTDCNHLWAWKKTQVMQRPSCYVFIKIKGKRPIAQIISFVREETQLKHQAATPFKNMLKKVIMDILFVFNCSWFLFPPPPYLPFGMLQPHKEGIETT